MKQCPYNILLKDGKSLKSSCVYDTMNYGDEPHKCFNENCHKEK